MRRLLRALFGHPSPPAHEPSVTAEDRQALKDMKAKQKDILGRADEAIRVGMEQAGRAFNYQGPDRRKSPR